MSAMPNETTLDSTLGLLREGYLFIGNRCRKHRSDAFSARFQLQHTICLRGAEVCRIRD